MLFSFFLPSIITLTLQQKVQLYNIYIILASVTLKLSKVHQLSSLTDYQIDLCPIHGMRAGACMNASHARSLQIHPALWYSEKANVSSPPTCDDSVLWGASMTEMVACSASDCQCPNLEGSVMLERVKIVPLPMMFYLRSAQKKLT